MSSSNQSEEVLQKRVHELQAELDAIKGKRAPVQGYVDGIPWDMHLRAYDVYCKKYGKQQALIEGWCRGGFGVEELNMFIPGWRGEISLLRSKEREIAYLRTLHNTTWIKVEDQLPEHAQDVNFIVRSRDEAYNGILLGGRFINITIGPQFCVPGMAFEASLWLPAPLKPQ